MSRTVLATLTRRLKHLLVAGAFLGMQLVIPLQVSGIAFADGQGNSTPPGQADTVTLCHRTDSETNPYTEITVSFDAATGQLKDNGQGDHTTHTGDVWYPGHPKDPKWGDIIPPYTWDNGGSYAGMNWTAAGQAILNNGCKPVTPVVVTPTAPSATTPSCADPTETVTPPTQDGVLWDPTSATVLQPGETVTYTASPDTNVVFAQGAQTSFAFTNSFDPSTCLPPMSGSITIEKDASPDSTQPFHFSTSGLSTDGTGFDLTDDIVGNPSRNFTKLGAGTYTVTEDSYAHWTLGKIDCGSSALATINKATRSVTITLDGSVQHVTCIFTNYIHRGTITVTKDVENHYGGTAQPTDFPLLVNTTSVSTGMANTFPSNHTYTVSEGQGPSGYQQKSLSCKNEAGTELGATFTLTPDENVNCVITNEDTPGTLIVKKIVVNDNGGTKQAQDFSFKVNGGTATNFDASGTNVMTVATGVYSIAEVAANGYTASYDNCTNLDIPLGGTATCTITNNDMPVSITGHKLEVNAGAHQGSGGVPVNNWTIYLLVNGQVKDQTTTAADGSFSFTGLNWGDYTLAECLNAIDNCQNWTQIYGPAQLTLNGDNLISADNDFGNFHNATIKGYKWNDQNGNRQKDRWERKLRGWTIQLEDVQGAVLATQITGKHGTYEFDNIVPGTYKVCEVMKLHWRQTFPGTPDGCQTVDIALSGHTYQANFGNRHKHHHHHGCQVDCGGNGGNQTPVTPSSIRFTDLNCTPGSKATYTVPTTPGVDYEVSLNGGVFTTMPAGTYTVIAGTTVAVRAVAQTGYVLDGALAFTHTFNGASDCALGETDVCSNLSGTQTTIPSGYVRNPVTGQCVQAGRGGGGQVLGTSTTNTSSSPQLVNTGDNALMSILASLSLVTVALGAWFVNRRPA